MNDKLKDLLLKLKSLAEQGVGGEKTTAEAMLQNLLKKHGVRMEDLESAHVDDYGFDVDPADYDAGEDLLTQVYAHVIGSVDAEYRLTPDRKKVLLLNLTPAQMLQIKAMYEFYLPRYKESRQLHRSAFVQKNGLAVVVPEGEERELSREELAKLKEMMGVIDQHQFMKSLKQ